MKELVLSIHQIREASKSEPLCDEIVERFRVNMEQPLIQVQLFQGTYLLLAGKIRLQAARQLGLKQVKVLLKEEKPMEQ